MGPRVDIGVFKSREADVMSNDGPLVMTVAEVAEYLRIPKSSVYKLAQEGRIPCIKAGRRWRFHRGAIDNWLSASSREPLQDDLE